MPYRLLPLLALLCASVAAQTAAPARPNVLFICVDDLKPQLGCYGDASAKTPNIDRLAQRGVLFERAYCNQAVCAPSRNALMTGLRPQRLGIYDLSTNFRRAVPNAVTLAQCFKANGYRTEAIGKIFHVGHGNHEDPASWSVPHFQAKAAQYALTENQGATRAGSRPDKDSPPLSRGAVTECADVPDETYADGMIASEAIRRLHAANEKPDTPFFLAVGFLKPHLPFVAPKKYWDLHDPAKLPQPTRHTPPDGAPVFAPTTWGELRQYSDIPETGPVSEALQRHLIHGYYAATSYMDAQLGRVLDELDQTGLAKNTLIVVWGDHGWHLGDHGMWCKHTNYEQAAHIPLLVIAPGVTCPGTRTRSLVETVDLYPTLCELAGFSPPSGLDGTSFVPVLKNTTAPTKEAVFHVFPRTPKGLGERIGRAVRTERYRLVEWKQPNAPADTAICELYDYLTDPEETKNSASTNPETVAKLRAILAAQPEAKPQIHPAQAERKTVPHAN